MAERGDPHDIRVRGMDDNAGDMLRVAEAHVRPGRAAVGGLVDSVAPVCAARQGVVAGARPHHIGVRRGDCQGADGRDSGGIGDEFPGSAAVRGAPHAAGASSGEHDVAMRLGGRFRYGQRGHPRAGAPRSEIPILEEFQQLGDGGIGREGAGGHDESEEGELPHQKRTSILRPSKTTDFTTSPNFTRTSRFAGASIFDPGARCRASAFRASFQVI